MSQVVFTDKFIRNVRIPHKDDKPNQCQYMEKQSRARGAPSLVLWVSYHGTKTWRVLFYVGGKPRSRRIGTYPAMTLAKARDALKKFDPNQAIASGEAGTFKDVAETWVREYVDEKKLRTKYEIVRRLTAYVYPAWGSRPMFSIMRIDVNKLLDHIKNKHGRSQADAVLATIRGIMSWYAIHDDRYNSPIVPKMQRDKRGAHERARTRILNDDEIRIVWKACAELGTYGAVIKMLLLTGQRLQKVARMQWSDLADGEWTIRTEAREKSNAGRIMLPQIARDIIDAQPHIAGNPYVFAAARGSGPIFVSSRKAELDALLPNDMPKWVLHDLRRSARSLMARAKVPDHIAERTLGHTIRGVAGIYNRHDYAEEKTGALNELARLIDSILRPHEGNIVPMRR